MESVSDSLSRAVCPSFIIYTFEVRKIEDFVSFLSFSFSLLATPLLYHSSVCCQALFRNFLKKVWKKFFKLEVWIKMLNRNRYRFYNEVISLILLFHQGKHQTLQWVCQCFSMFSIEGMWAIDLYRLVRMLLLSFYFYWVPRKGLEPSSSEERQIFLPHYVSITISVVVWTISSSQ